MRIGFDIDDTITRCPEFFAVASKASMAVDRSFGRLSCEAATDGAGQRTTTETRRHGGASRVDGLSRAPDGAPRW